VGSAKSGTATMQTRIATARLKKLWWPSARGNSWHRFSSTKNIDDGTDEKRCQFSSVFALTAASHSISGLVLFATKYMPLRATHITVEKAEIMMISGRSSWKTLMTLVNAPMIPGLHESIWTDRASGSQSMFGTGMAMPSRAMATAASSKCAQGSPSRKRQLLPSALPRHHRGSAWAAIVRSTRMALKKTRETSHTPASQPGTQTGNGKPKRCVSGSNSDSV